MQKVFLTAALALSLAGCATSPAAKCEASLSRQLAENQEQINAIQANISRGYALAPSRVSVGVKACASPIPNVSICAGGDRDIAQRHIPIEYAAEQAKLDAMKARRRALLSSQAQCGSQT